MKRGRSISDWMSSALTKGSASSQSNLPPNQKRKAASSQLNPPSTQKRRTVKKPTSLKQEAPNHQPKTTPLTAGSLLADSDVPWSVKYQPETAADLAVNKKKVSEVQQWMEFALSPRSRHPMLLLTGPPGCGKTATLHALARDMAFSIVEWVNPNTDALLPRDTEPRPGDLILYPESQAKQFRHFLVRANRYPSLQMGGAGEEGRERKVVLVEEFPNAFIRDPSKFHEVMHSVSPTLHYPLVFIVSESHRGESSSSSLFSKTALSTMDIHTISFNPIAHTSMVKTLQKVASSECQKTGTSKKILREQRKAKFHVPPKEVVENLAESSAGDIRSAINALQFACLKDPTDLLSISEENYQQGRKRERGASSAHSGGTKLKKRPSFEVDLCGIGGRDSSLFLFRALGKILYCKRDTQAEGDGKMNGSSSSSTVLPPHLKEHERPPLLVNCESVVEHTHMSPEMFTLYLHQNYIDFYEDIDDITAGTAYLSDADVLGRMWTDSSDTQASLLGYSTSVACRGLMHSNNPLHHSTSGGKWRPLHKPQWTAVNKQYRENCQAARGLFLHLGASPHAHLWTPIELQTELLPYLALSTVPLRNPGQVSLLQSITHFGSGYHRLRPECLGEKDVDSHLDVENAPEPSIRESSATEQGHASVGHSYSLKTSQIVQDGSHHLSSSQHNNMQSCSQDVHMGADDSDHEIKDFDDELL